LHEYDNEDLQNYNGTIYLQYNITRLCGRTTGDIPTISNIAGRLSQQDIHGDGDLEIPLS
jgi:hypothetical protein